MVSANVVDSVLSPRDALRSLYDNWKKEGNDKDFPDIVFNHFSTLFHSDEALSHVPLLDGRHPLRRYPTGTLVRFPAMVQDTSNCPELYISNFHDGRYCGGWSLEDDNFEVGEELSSGEPDYHALKERLAFWAVDIPGLAPWCLFDFDENTSNSDAHPHHDQAHDRYKTHKFPIAGSEHLAVQIKSYLTSIESLKPTVLAIFVGIFTLEPEHTESSLSDTLVPTLHVLFHRQIPKTIIPRSYPSTSFQASVRDRFISWFADTVLRGDRETAEWVLLCCISSVQSRNPLIAPLSLTISHFEKPATESGVPTLVHVLSSLLPLVTYVPLSLELLNNKRFAPESVNEDLHAGLLQLPQCTTVIISDSAVAEGQLQERGVRNISTLQDVVKQQTLRYDFPFSHFTFPTDLTIIALTEGRKSAFCETNVTMPLRPENSSPLYGVPPAVAMPSQIDIVLFRDLIGAAKCGNVTVSDVVSEEIQANFVSERQQDKSVTSEDLIRQMSIARLLTLSLHKTDMTTDVWAAAKDLDARRLSRCRGDHQ